MNKLPGSINDSPLVSIVIPTHNRRDFLVDAVRSCLDQSWRNIEVIIIDDGSTDSTDIMVAERLVKDWPQDQVRYIRQLNRGASAARNHGIKLARGAYIQFLDSDDLLLTDKIAKQVTVLVQSHNREAACCYCYGRIGANSEGGTSGALARIGVKASSPEELVQSLCSRLTHGMPTSAPLWRRDFLLTHAGWREDIGLGDDLEYHIRLLVDAKQICFINEDLFFVREHSGPRLGATKINASSLSSIIQTRQAIFESVQQSGMWNAGTQQAFLSAMRTIYANALEIGNNKTIADLEGWLWRLSSSPRRMTGLQLTILTRRLLGYRVLLVAHALFSRLKQI